MPASLKCCVAISLDGTGGCWIADAEDGRRLGVVVAEECADKLGSAGVEGGGCGPGGDSESTKGVAESATSIGLCTLAELAARW